jgi:glycosyltransferase involved in cell wall biosynthesis
MSDAHQLITNCTVSVFLLTYNQEQYISQTLDSILSQETDFSYKIIIGDDASDDNTSIICSEYASRFPDKIEYHRHSSNLGLMGNFIKTATRLKGKYIAICDGDDYWIDSLKLQKQVGFLEENHKYVLVGTGVQLVLKNGEISEKVQMHFQEISLEELIEDNKISAPTAVFRNYLELQNLPPWFNTIPYGDWPLYLMALQKYEAMACILPEVTAAYRLQSGVSFKMRKNLSSVFKNNARILEFLATEKLMEPITKRLYAGSRHQKIKQVLALNNERELGRGFLIFIKLMALKPSIQMLKHYLYSLKKQF